MTNPTLPALQEAIGGGLIFGEVLIQKSDGKFALRHHRDSEKDITALKKIQLTELRKLVQLDAAGNFRPLLSAPTLVSGWILSLNTASELYDALNILYPGAVADWFAVMSPSPPITDYRAYTNRQTGMYRIAATLDDAAAAEVIQTGCAASNCLKRRLWSVPGLPPDAAPEKSLIPCLELCPILLELARKTARIFLDKQNTTVKA